MTLIKSISGIRGTIGGKPGDNLTPLDISKFAAAYGTWIKASISKPTVVIGRDARISGEMVSQIISHTLVGLGIDVIDLGLSTTPTVEIAVPMEKASGGIIITASHNPQEWNALKLLNNKGEFLSADEGAKIIKLADEDDFDFSDVLSLGKITKNEGYIQKHIDAILALDLVDVEAIKSRKFRVAIDAVNSTGGISLPPLLDALGVTYVEKLYCEPNGKFPHNPEPLPQHLTEICGLMKEGNYDVGFVVDPDVDRLAIIDEEGGFVGEEYTLVLIADYVLSQTPGTVVSNMSSSSALSVVAEKHGQKRLESAVGEVNVVTLMKANHAVIGGEGNGGIIYPPAHYGRDSLVGIALFLTYLAKSDKTTSRLRSDAPPSFISKNKIDLGPGIDPESILEHLKVVFAAEQLDERDGLKITFGTEWAHIRKSNTEPIIRIYSESSTKEKSHAIFQKIENSIGSMG